ncbi:MAG: hypothetical protein NW226_05535 [Microscillaceae bacterium]|nr:hypothetical protein [Microscillaceae bacterium]
MKKHYNLTRLALMCLLFACNTGGNQQNEQGPDSTQIKTVKETSVREADIPNALENFDKTFVGKLGDAQVHMNLRRYGSNLSGTLWFLNSLEELYFKGILQDEGNNFALTIQDKKGANAGEFIGLLDESKGISGKWKDSQGVEKDFNLASFQGVSIENIKVDDLELNQDSNDGKRRLRITYPQLLGIKDEKVSNKVNNDIEYYFEEYTLLDSIDVPTLEFSEDVKFEVTFMGNDLISICKNHHLSKNKDTHIFEDSHGININFKRGKIYEIQDLFKPNALDQLNAMIIARIDKSCGGALSEKDLQKCKLQAHESNSFSLSKKNQNITFHLTERLPYKYRGCGYVRISYEELKEYFNPSGPLKDLLPKS